MLQERPSWPILPRPCPQRRLANSGEDRSGYVLPSTQPGLPHTIAAQMVVGCMGSNMCGPRQSHAAPLCHMFGEEDQESLEKPVHPDYGIQPVPLV